MVGGNDKGMCSNERDMGSGAGEVRAGGEGVGNDVDAWEVGSGFGARARLAGRQSILSMVGRPTGGPASHLHGDITVNAISHSILKIFSI